MGSHFHNWIGYYGVNGVAHFKDFEGQKIQVCRDLKIEDLHHKFKFNKNVAVHFKMF